jgi:hypothetical protein
MVVIGVRLQRGRRRLLIRTMLPQPNSCPCSAGTSLLGDGGCWQASVGEAQSSRRPSPTIRIRSTGEPDYAGKPTPITHYKTVEDQYDDDHILIVRDVRRINPVLVLLFTHETRGGSL